MFIQSEMCRCGGGLSIFHLARLIIVSGIMRKVNLSETLRASECHYESAVEEDEEDEWNSHSDDESYDHEACSEHRFVTEHAQIDDVEVTIFKRNTHHSSHPERRKVETDACNDYQDEEDSRCSSVNNVSSSEGVTNSQIPDAGSGHDEPGTQEAKSCHQTHSIDVVS